MNVSPPSSSPRRAKHHGRPASNSIASSSPGARPNDNVRIYPGRRRCDARVPRGVTRPSCRLCGWRRLRLRVSPWLEIYTTRRTTRPRDASRGSRGHKKRRLTGGRGRSRAPRRAATRVPRRRRPPRALSDPAASRATRGASLKSASGVLPDPATPPALVLHQHI